MELVVGRRAALWLALTLAGALVIVVAAATRASTPEAATASSHREAPLIADDPAADNTDVYAFVSPDKPDTVTIIANYIPLEEPAGGPNFDEVRRRRPLRDQDRQHGRRRGGRHLRVPLRDRRSRNPNTFLYNTGPIDSLVGPGLERAAVLQRHADRPARQQDDAAARRDVPTPPVNIGPRSTPNYAVADGGGGHAAARRRARSSPASATTRSSSTSARSSTSPACGRSTRRTSSRCRRTRRRRRRRRLQHAHDRDAGADRAADA